MQFKFSPDKLNYSSWRRLRQKTKWSRQSVSHQPQDLLQSILEKGKPCPVAPQGEVLLLASQESPAPRPCPHCYLLPFVFQSREGLGAGLPIRNAVICKEGDRNKVEAFICTWKELCVLYLWVRQEGRRRLSGFLFETE